ncbi:rod shape-determining protein MreD [Algicola sagamiensis]|uniref:rod shape-determining protein MreD n=1 Tax=Algicola sagamiensis TaxID=163869 RepID=UPI000364BB97|nr:rod shape-determining protein MreD [Algicola sagamiensis]
MGDNTGLRSNWYIFLTILSALVLSMMPVPIQLELFRPDWPLLVVLYWCLALPNRVNIGVAWLTGFAMDIMMGSVFGVYAISFTITSVFCLSNYQTIRNFSVWQQSLLIAVLLCLYHLLVFWFSRFFATIHFIPNYLWPAMTGALCWPWVFWLLRKLRRQFSIQ